MKKILVVGSINMDLVFCVDNLPQKGQTIFGTKFETHHGGKGANQAFIIGRLKGNVEMIGMVGDDAYGHELIEGLASAGLITEKIGFSNQATGTANIIVDQNGDNTIVVTQGANFDYAEDFIKDIKEAIKECDYLILQLEIPYQVVKELALFAHEQGRVIILNPAPARKLDRELLSVVDYLVPNETELGIISEKYFVPNLKEARRVALSYWQDYHLKNLIVTLGHHGSLYISEAGDVELIPIQKVATVDSTGAGDSYLGAFVFGLSQGYSPKEALAFAAKVGAIVVTRPGAQASMPTIDEVQTYQFQ